MTERASCSPGVPGSTGSPGAWGSYVTCPHSSPAGIEVAGRASRRRRCLRCEVRHLALCAALGEEELPQLEAIAKAVSLEPGRVLFAEGDPVRHVYNVDAGTLRLFRLLPDGRRQIVGFGMAGDFVGLSADGLHPHAAEAVGKVELCQFPIERDRKSTRLNSSH